MNLRKVDEYYSFILANYFFLFSGIRHLGPCSVHALKTGSLDRRWDTPAMHSLLHGKQTSASKN